MIKYMFKISRDVISQKTKPLRGAPQPRQGLAKSNTSNYINVIQYPQNRKVKPKKALNHQLTTPDTQCLVTGTINMLHLNQAG
jgi:hypothetical protein